MSTVWGKKWCSFKPLQNLYVPRIYKPILSVLCLEFVRRGGRGGVKLGSCEVGCGFLNRSYLNVDILFILLIKVIDKIILWLRTSKRVIKKLCKQIKNTLSLKKYSPWSTFDLNFWLWHFSVSWTLITSTVTITKIRNFVNITATKPELYELSRWKTYCRKAR